MGLAVRLLALCVLVVGYGRLASAAEQPSQPLDWLKRMIEARQTLNYEGDFVYLHNNRLAAMRVIHQADRSGARERLLSLNGPVREVVRDKDQVTCIRADDDSVVVDKRRPGGAWSGSIPKRLDEVVANYDLVLGKTDRVAGRETQVLEIVPKDDLRYGHRLWADRSTGLLLKSEVLDRGGGTLEQIMFTDISVKDSIPEAALELGSEGQRLTWKRSREPRADVPGAAESRWEVTRLPSGFRMEEHDQHPMPHAPRPVDHLVFSDGLAMVSVFIEKLDAKEEHGAWSGASRMGAVNAFGRHYEGYEVTVVGEVPAATVRQIGESLRRR